MPLAWAPIKDSWTKDQKRTKLGPFREMQQENFILSLKLLT